MIVQKLKKLHNDNYELAERYYSLMSSLNNLKMTQREIQLVAHCSIHGNISHSHIKEEFCEKHNTSVQTISNMISRLKKKNVFIKEKGKIKTNPLFILKFDEDVVLQIRLLHNNVNNINNIDNVNNG